MHGSLGELERRCAQAGAWLVGGRLTQADVTSVTAYSFLHDALAFSSERYPALHAHAQRCEALSAFGDTRVPFFRPQPTN
ncbi:MAG TPA: glutathione S-transferase C-terminal domain-containing protein [Fontimonas sp.]